MKQFFTLLIYILLIIPAQGQSVRASVESSEVYLGQPFEYRIIVEGTTDAEAPDLGNIAGIATKYKGASTSMISSFGLGSNSNSNSKTITYSWSFTALRKGELLIPSFDIEIEGKTYKTSSGTITVKDPEPIDGFFLFMETEKNNFWFGEPIILKIKWLFSSSVSNPSFNLPFVNSGLFTVENQEPAPGNEVFKLNINGLDVLAMQSAEIYKGEQYSSLSFSLKLLPEDSGTFNLEPVTLAFDSAERSNGFRTTYNSSVIPSNRISLEIKKLPVDAYENGQRVVLSSGPLNISASAVPLQVHIGDPLTYTIILEDIISPETTVLPSLNSFDLMNKNFSIPDRQSPGKVDNKSVSFSQTIRVKESEVKSVPQLKFKYFNTRSGKVETAIIDPIIIDVLETEIVTSANLESTGYISSENFNKTELITNDQGLLFNYPLEKMIAGHSKNKEHVLKNPLYWILLFLPVLSYLIIILFNKRSFIISLIEGYSSNTSAFSKKYKLLSSKNDLDEIEVIRAIEDFLLMYCDQAGKHLTPIEISHILNIKNNDEIIVEKIRALLLSFEEAAYSKNKLNIDWRSVLNEFYTLSKELK